MPVPAMTDTKCSSFRLMCARILLITCRSSIHAMILMAPWQCLRTVTSKSNYVGDKCWRVAKRMVNFPEYQYTCIGYSSGNTD